MTTPAQPADGVEALAPAAAVAYACLRESGYHEAAANLREYLRTLAASAVRDWTEDASHENGDYQCRCVTCGNIFIGHKRRVVCKACATGRGEAVLLRVERGEGYEDVHPELVADDFVRGAGAGFAWSVATSTDDVRSNELARARDAWLPIESAPTDRRVMFVVRAFNAQLKPGLLYTSDPWCVWAEKGRFVRWPHDFQPTHWCPLPEPPAIDAASMGNNNGR